MSESDSDDSDASGCCEEIGEYSGHYTEVDPDEPAGCTNNCDTCKNAALRSICWEDAERKPYSSRKEAPALEKLRALFGMKGWKPDVNRASVNGWSPLYIAVSDDNNHHGHEGLVKLLLEKKADASRQADAEGLTPLILACESKADNSNVVRRLLAAKADV